MADTLGIRRKKAAVEKKLLKLKGVTGVGVGEKITKGERTGERCIRVYVKKKMPKTRLAKGQAIPAKIEGVPTDVIEREFLPHPLSMPLADLEAMADSGTYDPLTGGISIGPCRSIGGSVFVGTLGLVVEDNNNGDRMMLSNFHVMCVNNGWSVGDTMAQPARAFDGGTCPADVVGTLTRASLGGQVDCAVATITNRGHNCNITQIGNVSGTATAVDGEAVRKRGRTTELTHGFVDDISLTVQIDYEQDIGIVTLTNQIGIEYDPAQSTMFGTNGDSGSVVVNSSDKVIGLYFAGTADGKYGAANPIASVLSALDVRLCTAGPTTVWDDIATAPWNEDIFETIKYIDEPPTIIWYDTSPWNDFPTWIWETTQETVWETVREEATWIGETTETLLETVQEQVTWQEEVNTMQEVIGPDPRIPRNPPVTGPPRTPFGAGGGGGGDLDAEIERAKRYLESLEARKASGR